MRTVGRLLAFLRPFAGEAALSILLSAGTVVASIGLMGTSAYLIASAALRPSIAELQVAIVGVRFFGISRGVLRYLERLATHSVNFRLLAKLRVWFYQAVEPLAPARLEDMRGGDLLNRAAVDIDGLEDFYVRAVAPPVTALVVTFGICLFVGQYAALLGWVLAAGLVASGAAVPWILYAAARRAGKGRVMFRTSLSEEVVDGIRGLADLAAFGKTEVAARKIAAASREYERSQASLARAGGLGTALHGLSANLTVYLLLLIAIPLVSAGAMDGISLAVLALAALASFESTAPLGQVAQNLEGALQSARRLFELADRQPAVIDPAEGKRVAYASSASVSIRGLSFRYRAGLADVLCDISLDLPPGKRCAVVGPNGAGKSTLGGLLARLYDCPPGTIFLDGRDIRNYPAQVARDRIAYAPQPVYLFSGTLRQNLLLARPGAGDFELDQVVEAAGLEELVGRLSRGLDGRIGSQGEQLSGGERQRVALARTLLSGAGLLILDEPAAGLDAAAAGRLLEVLRTTTHGRSLVVITHRLSGLEWFDEIVVLREGKVVERGTHAELVAAGGWYQKALALQGRLLEKGEL